MKKEKSNGGFWVGVIIAAFGVAVTLYVVMIQMEKKMLIPYEQESVMVTKKEIPRGELLTEQNLEEYFEEKLTDKSLLPESAIRDKNLLIGKVTLLGVDAGCMVTGKQFDDMDTITEAMEHPVIAGFRAEDVSQMVGGVLRAGDRIHIYCMDEETKTWTTWQNRYVQQVFDSSGVAISNEDEQTGASRINIYLDEKEIESFYEKLSEGNVKVVKIYEKKI